MGPCYSIGPKSVQIFFAGASVHPSSLNLNHSCYRLAHLILDSPWVSPGPFLMCLQEVSHIWKLSFVKRAKWMSCDIQWLFLNTCEHKFVSQDFQYSHNENEYLNHMSIGSYSYCISLCSVITSALSLHQLCFKPSDILILIVSQKWFLITPSPICNKFCVVSYQQNHNTHFTYLLIGKQIIIEVCSACMHSGWKRNEELVSLHFLRARNLKLFLGVGFSLDNW